MSGLTAGLAIVQVLIAAAATGLDGGGTGPGKLVFGLHAVNGLAILAVTTRIVRQARRLAQPDVPQRQAA